MNNAAINTDDVFESALDTHSNSSYVIVGDFNGKYQAFPQASSLCIPALVGVSFFFFFVGAKWTPLKLILLSPAPYKNKTC